MAERKSFTWSVSFLRGGWFDRWLQARRALAEVERLARKADSSD